MLAVACELDRVLSRVSRWAGFRRWIETVSFRPAMSIVKYLSVHLITG